MHRKMLSLPALEMSRVVAGLFGAKKMLILLHAGRHATSAAFPHLFAAMFLTSRTLQFVLR
jgi:hypothetical protein